METLLTIILIYLIQCCLCAIIHIINGSNKIPLKGDFKSYIFKLLNIFWVFKNLKYLRS